MIKKYNEVIYYFNFNTVTFKNNNYNLILIYQIIKF